MESNSLDVFMPTCKAFYKKYRVSDPIKCRAWLLRRAFDEAVHLGYLGSQEEWWSAITGQDLD